MPDATVRVSPREMVASFWRNRSLIKAMVLREVTGRYPGSVLGSPATTAPFLLFLNPDYTLESGSLSQLLTSLKADEYVGMAERMNNDMVFDHSEDARDFCFSPRPFQLTLDDLPE